MQTKLQIEQLLCLAGVRPNKRYGQNFLIDLNLMRVFLDKASLTEKDLVLEVGCGTGSLTQGIAEHAGRVVAVDIDPTMAEIAADELEGFQNVEIINTDILAKKHELSEEVMAKVRAARENCDGRFLLVANLPYNAASPLMANLVTGDMHVDAMYVTVQKEVAMRMAAKPGGKDYGPLTVLLQARGKVEIFRILKPDVFWPRPDVESAMVEYEYSTEMAGRIKDLELFKDCVNLFMSHRRKMMKACVKFTDGRLEKVDDWSMVFSKCGIDGTVRGEQISVADYIKISNMCFDLLQQ